ncbi:uncharacterized protein LOC120625066 [Pararge aegeria]|uniref:uncharacterized protein LOC120625066 n=1 Tax=Pararge aegeria TaxID=116150 RepID=UPI0019D03033|nr:uncharacterized protein LOC120625066 [Pararge aegeria]
MDTIKQSLQELSQHFNTTMAEFQHNLSTSIPATSPTSNISAQFSMFRTFVLSALENLQQQVEHLSKQQDKLEMNSRRKILLVYGIPDVNGEDTLKLVVKTLSDHLNMPDLSVADVSRCHRMGSIKSGKQRAILLKFKQLSLRNQVWYDKTKLKGTGITLSEFLTRDRHAIFMEARQRFGVSKCWTKDGSIFVVQSNGSRRRIVAKSELDSIPCGSDVQRPAPSAVVASSAAAPPKSRPAALPAQVNRSRRIVKK